MFFPALHFLPDDPESLAPTLLLLILIAVKTLSFGIQLPFRFFYVLLLPLHFETLLSQLVPGLAELILQSGDRQL